MNTTTPATAEELFRSLESLAAMPQGTLVRQDRLLRLEGPVDKVLYQMGTSPPPGIRLWGPVKMVTVVGPVQRLEGQPEAGGKGLGSEPLTRLFVALRRYRTNCGVDARLAVVAMASNGFTIADPADRGMLDVVGFDTATPEVLAAFSRGEL